MTSYWTATPVYDNGNNTVGNITGDQTLGYLYDAQGHICAAHGVSGWIGYVYNAEGNRVAKVPLTTAPTSCDPNTNGILANISMATLYVLGPDGEKMTEVVDGTWAKTHVTTGSVQLATYDGNGVHFHVQDWIGTHRVQTNAAGIPEDSCTNQPFGDQQNCYNLSSDVSDTHFTGKDRDSESGLDYFGARYLNSSMGRWPSPDPSGLALADPGNPQTLNLFAFVGNNPLSNVDPNGLSWFTNPCTDSGPGTGAQASAKDLFTEAATFIGNLFCSGPGSGGGGSGIDPIAGGPAQSGGKPQNTPSPPSLPPSVGTNPCSDANPANLNYQTINNYRDGGKMTSLQHIVQNHVLPKPGKSRYTGGGLASLDPNAAATANMLRLNALTLKWGRLVKPIINDKQGQGTAVLSYLSPKGEIDFDIPLVGKGTLHYGNVGSDTQGNSTQINTLVVTGCTNPRTSHPGPPR